MNPGAKQGTILYEPPAYQRLGPGTALDSKPKLDLTRLDPAYFDRLRKRVMAARDKGVFASVMLFNGFSVEGKGNVGGDPWQGHPFNPKNNINGIDGRGGGAIHTLSNSAVTALQETYVRNVIDTVNDLDNILYEEWFDAAKSAIAGAGRIDSSGKEQQFKAPFDGDAVLYLKAE